MQSEKETENRKHRMMPIALRRGFRIPRTTRSLGFIGIIALGIFDCSPARPELNAADFPKKGTPSSRPSYDRQSGQYQNRVFYNPSSTSEAPTEVIPSDSHDADQIGLISYYNQSFQGKRTASGAHYDNTALTAAHPTLPFNSRVRVTNLTNGKSVVVVINDRGPFKSKRILDVSYEAARQLQMISAGTTKASLKVL